MISLNGQEHFITVLYPSSGSFRKVMFFARSMRMHCHRDEQFGDRLDEDEARARYVKDFCWEATNTTCVLSHPSNLRCCSENLLSFWMTVT